MIGVAVALFAVAVFFAYRAYRGLQRRKNPTEPRLNVQSTEAFYTKVSGVTQKNDDGSDRQQILKGCSAGETLDLIRDPKNPYDKNAIRVCRESGEQLGYIPAETAKRLAQEIDWGIRVAAEIANITGDTEDRPALGCNLKIIYL